MILVIYVCGRLKECSTVEFLKQIQTLLKTHQKNGKDVNPTFGIGFAIYKSELHCSILFPVEVCEVIAEVVKRCI